MKKEDYEIINELIEKKEEFSIHSIRNKEGATEDEAKKIALMAQKDSRIQTYYFLVCPSCNGSCGKGIFSKELVGTRRTCFHCKNKFQVKISHIELFFDPKTITERFELLESE